MSKYFNCPICKEDVEVGEFGVLDSSGKEFRLMNKRYHMVCHKKEKQRLEKERKRKSRTALVDGTG